MVPKASPAKKIPYPGYVARNPQFPAYRSLRQIAGLQDNLINLSEVTLRHFERELATRDDAAKFVEQVAIELGVNTTFGAPWREVRGNAHRYAIAQAYGVFDTFCRQLGSEFRYFHRPSKWIAQQNGQQADPLTTLTLNMDGRNRKAARECPEFDLLQFYRITRNRIIHYTDDDTDAVRQTVVDQHRQHLLSAYGHVPNDFASLDYADYSILTRAMKYFAAVLNDACDLRVAVLAKSLLAEDSFLAKARRRKGNASKLATLARAVGERYALSDDQRREFYEEILRFLEADPSHKVRRRSATRTR